MFIGIDRFIAYGWALALVGLCIVVANPLILFFDLTSILVVVFGGLALVVVTHGIVPTASTIRLMPTLCVRATDMRWHENRLAVGALVARTGQRMTWMAGCIGMVVGALHCVLSTCDRSGLGIAASVTLLCLFYALMVNAFVWIPIERFCKTAVEQDTRLIAIRNATNAQTPGHTSVGKKPMPHPLIFLAVLAIGYAVGMLVSWLTYA